MLAVYCRLPRFLKGDKGLFLAPVPPAEFPEGRLEDMSCGSAWLKLGREELSESELRRTERRKDTQ